METSHLARCGEELRTTFVREIAAHYRGPRRTQIQVGGPSDAARFMRGVFPDNSREHFVALYLDGAHKVMAFSIVATGCANSCPVHPREVFQNAILSGAISIIIGHNHPSGSTTPSAEDRKVTEVLKAAGELLGIRVLDHVIVGEDDFYSFASNTELLKAQAS